MKTDDCFSFTLPGVSCLTLPYYLRLNKHFSIDQEDKDRITWSVWLSKSPKVNCNQKYWWNWENEKIRQGSYMFVFMDVQTAKSGAVGIFSKNAEERCH